MKQRVAERIEKAKKSEILKLSNCELTSIPDEIFNDDFKHLATILLGNSNPNRKNTIKTIPKEICIFSELEELNFANNQIKQIPCEIGQLQNLEELNISNNALTEIPKEIAKLGKLRIIKLEGNPLKKPPIEVAEQGIEAIRAYFKSLKEGEGVLNEAKLIMIGDGRVGKTTIAKNLKNGGKYGVHPDEESTHGLDILKWKLNYNDLNFTFNIWDFGGQGHYRAIQQFFCTRNAIYLFVESSEEEKDSKLKLFDKYSNSDYWILFITAYSYDSTKLKDKDRVSPLIQVFNQKQKDVLDPSDLTYPNEPIIKTIVDCNDKHSVKSLSDSIKEKFLHADSPLSNRIFPKNWLDVKKELEGEKIRRRRKKPQTITREDFNEICKKKGLDKTETEIWLKALNSMGSILHYDYPNGIGIINETVVLDPNWVRQIAYAVLNPAAIKDGIFYRKDFSKIWKEEKFNEAKHNQYIKLLKPSPFELIFELKLDVSTFFVPALFKKDFPESYRKSDIYKSWENKTSIIQREFHFKLNEKKFLPAGFFSRLIVKLNEFIEVQKEWFCDKGVVIKSEGAIAELTEVWDEHKIIAKIQGEKRKTFHESYIVTGINQLIKQYNIEKHVALAMNEKVICNCPKCSKSDEPYRYEYTKLLHRKDKNMITVPCVKSDVDNVDIDQLLYGKKGGKMSTPIKIFISYAHEDEKYKDGLCGHMQGLERSGLVKIWTDEQILPGKAWDNKIKEQLEQSDIVIFLVSRDFMNSKYINDVEIKKTSDREKQDLVIIIPILIRPYSFNTLEMSKHKALPKNLKPISKWKDQDEGWVDVVNQLEKLISSLVSS